MAVRRCHTRDVFQKTVTYAGRHEDNITLLNNRLHAGGIGLASKT
jgi:hypothetical protein